MSETSNEKIMTHRCLLIMSSPVFLMIRLRQLIWKVRKPIPDYSKMRRNTAPSSIMNALAVAMFQEFRTQVYDTTLKGRNLFCQVTPFFNMEVFSSGKHHPDT